MCKTKFVQGVMMFTLGLVTGIGEISGATTTHLFQITSGEYTECCGIAGSLKFRLPNAQQTYVSLAVDSNQLTARMTVVGDDRQTIYRVFDDGRLQDGVIEFGRAAPFPPVDGSTYLHYIVSNSVGGIRFDGVIEEPVTGVDIPNHFTHTNVVAVSLPSAPQTTIRISETEICWRGESNRLYQVEYASSLSTNFWLPLGPRIPGNGGTNCVRDPISPGEPRRFYRVTNAL